MQHERKRTREWNPEWDEDRPSARARGYDKRHEQWRKMVLNRDPVCVVCLEDGRVRASRVADHIRPLADGGSWSLDNGQGLCTTCHNRKTAQEKREGRV